MFHLKEIEPLIPKFVRTKHCPLLPNASRDDLVASEEEFRSAIMSGNVTIEEKVDGANSGIRIMDGLPCIRNRSHILNKSFMARTPAKKQFSSIWNWAYSNIDKFLELEDLLGFCPTVYGEWLYAVHSVKYTELPDLFIPFDIYDPEERKFLSPIIYRDLFEKAGFFQIPFISDKIISDEKLINIKENGISSFSSGNKMEGLYIKICNGKFITNRFKMVRTGFIQGENWNDVEIQKNIVKRN